MYETPEGNYCQCGCGMKVAEGKRFINHHHAKDCSCSVCKAKRGELLGEKNPMFGTHRSGMDNPFYGKKHTIETKVKMRKPKKDSSTMGKHKRTEEIKKKQSESMIQLWSDPENKKRLIKIKRNIEYREKLSKKKTEYHENNPDIIKGENNPNWRGGLSKLPYTQDWTEDLKDSIRKRDNYFCQICNKSQEETGRKLDVHHIDYDKENCDPNNLISLCHSCHTKTTSGNRERWKVYFYRRVRRERRVS
jgi:hypothetical protein